VEAGALSRCPIIGDTPLSGKVPTLTDLGSTGVPTPWDDGVKYVRDGGPDAGTPAAAAAGFVGPPTIRVPEFTCGDSGAPADAGADAEAGTTTTPPLIRPPPPHATGAARADNLLYVADDSIPVIHVIDVSDYLHPTEITPLLATSAAQPTRAVRVGGLAVSPFTRDYKRYLYAIDQTDNPPSIIVYDITDPTGTATGTRSSHVPLTRPHAVITPQFAVDRIQFTAPVAAVAFGSHDFPITQDPISGANFVGAAYSGLLCNPNPNVNLSEVIASDGAVVDASFKDPGAFYRNNFQVQQVPLGPTRLRGIYGFATLSNGEVVLIDVDDWDSPCRRPVGMNVFTSDIAPPEQATPPFNKSNKLTQPNQSINPLETYQVPEAGQTNGTPWVTGETFFPSTQPHRARSQYNFNNDPLLGIHYPQVQVQPQLFNIVTGSGLAPGADAGDPTLFPTATTLADPSGYEGGAGVRLAWEDPLVHANQSWNVTYEGALPTFSQNIPLNIEMNPKDDMPFETLVLTTPNGLFCRRGVEDQMVGLQRVAAARAAAVTLTTTNGMPNGNVVDFPPNMEHWVGDYVQVTASLPPQTSAVWSLPSPDGCFGPDGGVQDQTVRYEQCLEFFQPFINQVVARDFPILEAYDDHLVISRFSYPPDNPPDGGADAAALFPVPEMTTNRTIMGPDKSNQAFLRNLKCCFHDQLTVNVRTGGEWVAVGSVSGLLHHVTADPTTNRCVLSCNPQEALLNARNVGFYTTTNFTGGCANSSACLDRNSALAMRNPMFAYFVTHPVGPAPWLSPSNTTSFPTNCMNPSGSCVPQRVPRDLSWEFTMINAFTNQLVNLAGTGTQLSPQSMLFIPALGQVAVVDGAQEGLVLIDLSTVAVSGVPYN
jgi:hypothetical protein